MPVVRVWAAPVDHFMPSWDWNICNYSCSYGHWDLLLPALACPRAVPLCYSCVHWGAHQHPPHEGPQWILQGASPHLDLWICQRVRQWGWVSAVRRRLWGCLPVPGQCPYLHIPAPFRPLIHTSWWYCQWAYWWAVQWWGPCWDLCTGPWHFCPASEDTGSAGRGSLSIWLPLVDPIDGSQPASTYVAKRHLVW